MKIQRNQNYNSANQNRPVKLNLDIGTLNILCRYLVSSSSSIKVNNIMNLRKLIYALDPSTYSNDLEKSRRIDFMMKGLEARLDYHLTDYNMIMTHISGGLTWDVDFIDQNNLELNKSELEWVNKLISETLEYQFIYEKVDRLKDLCTRFDASDYLHRGDIVKEFEVVVDEMKNDFRHAKLEDNSTDMVFSLRDDVFENSIRDIYDIVTSPSRRLICGMTGLNEMLGGGFENGRVYMLFGISGVGKSLTLLNLLVQIKKYNVNYKTKDPTKIPCVVLLTMENTVVETITRLFSMSDPNGGDMGNYNIDEVLSILRSNGELHLDSSSPINILIKYKANKTVDTSYLYTLYDDLSDDGYEVICMIQDHVKRIRSIYHNPDLRLELGDVVNEMKVFAAEKDIPFISVSHLNREAAKTIEDNMAKGGGTDITKTLGKSTVGESLLMIDNLDAAITINVEYDADMNKYMAYNLIKMRDHTDRKYIVQPFVYGSDIRLVEDVNTVPMFKESLLCAPNGRQRSSSIVVGTSVEQMRDLISDKTDSESNSFDKRKKDVVEHNGHPVVKPVYTIDSNELANDIEKLKAKTKKKRQSKKKKEEREIIQPVYIIEN